MFSFRMARRDTSAESLFLKNKKTVVKEMRFALIEFMICLALTFNLINDAAPAPGSQRVVDAHHDSIALRANQPFAAEHSSSSVSMDSLIKLIALQQEKLTVLEQTLQQTSFELSAREQEFHKLETEIQSFRKISSFLLVAGLISLIGGILFWVLENGRRLKAKFDLKK